ncbi:hypothetical protein PAMP_014186 [Pampus punctatissimus]
MLSLLTFLYLSLVWTKGEGASDPAMPFVVYLDNNHLVCLKWGFDDLEGIITFKLEVNTTGWVGFGLSPNGGMAGSDIVIGGLGPNGQYFTDSHATGNSMPVVDKQQSYTLQSLTESDGQTIMTFRRSLQTCDEQDFHITAKPIKLIYAYGTTDEIEYHRARRGTKEVNLLNYMPRTILPNLKYISATVENIEPVIDHPDLVHHMLLYSCPPYVTQPYDSQCFTGDIGDFCFGVIATWGLGGGVYEFPEEVGVPVGDNGDMYYRLEIHYNNPTKEKGRTDNSGLRLYYTDQLRQYDVGTLTTGFKPFDEINYKIPPGANEFHTYGVCNTTLFYQIMNPVPDLHVFSVMLHTHMVGRKVRVGHFRNGKQIDFLGLDENYDFEIQETVSLGNLKTIKPMGLASTDEMCLAFLLFYPAINITTCVSTPNLTSYETSLSVTTSNQ